MRKTIRHLKLYLRQDADMLAVREIVDAYSSAKLDEDNYVVYYDTEPNRVDALIAELHNFVYGITLNDEVI